MANSDGTIAHLIDTLAAAGAQGVAARKMFGEHALYLGGKVVALVCGDRLFIKPTPGARALMPGADEGPPYPGARAHLAGDALLDDGAALLAVLRAVADDLPAPPPKPRRAAR
jgi:hypothetical protein